MAGTSYIDHFRIEVCNLVPVRMINMKCSKCGAEINSLTHYYVPLKNRGEGMRYCFKCAREEHIITLV